MDAVGQQLGWHQAKGELLCQYTRVTSKPSNYPASHSHSLFVKAQWRHYCILMNSVGSWRVLGNWIVTRMLTSKWIFQECVSGFYWDMNGIKNVIDRHYIPNIYFYTGNIKHKVSWVLRAWYFDICPLY